MRVAVIGHTYILEANRGKLRCLSSLCGNLLFIAPDAWPEKDFGPRAFEPPGNLDGRPLPIRFGGRVRLYHFGNEDFKRTLGEFSPDILHVEAEAGSAAALQSARAARALGCRLTQFCWENIPMRPGIRKMLASWNFDGVGHLFCGSSGAVRTAKEDGYRGEASVVPQVGVDLESIGKAIPLRLFPETEFTVGVVARLDAKKGVIDVIRALADPSCKDARLAAIGDGPDRAVLEDVARNTLSERVRFAGAVRHEDVARYMKGFDVLVLASRDVPGWREQFGHVLVEGMAAGTPVIGSDSGAIPEVIGDAGIVFHQGKVDELAAAVSKLMKDRDLRARLAGAGRKRAKEMFTDDVIAKKMFKVWQGMKAEG